MAVFTREVSVDAPLPAVWEFHSTVDGLIAMTPSVMRMRVESVREPDDGADPAVLEVDSTVALSMRPFGIGPRQRWTSRITERRRAADDAWFTDEMVDGPFERWTHVHHFLARDGGTLARDRVVYELPGGPVGRLVSPLARVGLAPMFAARHRRLRNLLESGGDAGQASREPGAPGSGSDAGRADYR